MQSLKKIHAWAQMQDPLSDVNRTETMRHPLLVFI